jgi:restriction endonuclease S subunit
LEIPSHWALTTVENTTRELGFFCDGDWVESKDQDPDGDVRLIQLADVGDGEYRDRSSRFMTKTAAKRLNCSYLEAGDILIARMPDPLGRCCRFPGDSKPAVTVVDVCILRSNITFFNPDFLVVAINCPRFRRLVSAQATGTTRSRISRSNLAVLPIPLPPLAEQQRIVAKVDELMALCDRLEAQHQERETRRAALARASLARFADAPNQGNLSFLFHPSYDIASADLRESILALAVQGKLVSQDPKDEPAESSIEQVSTDAKKAIRDGIIRRHGLEETPDDSELSELPFGWRWTRLVEVTRPVQYAIKRGPFGSAVRKDMFVPSGFKVYEQQHAISGDFTRGRYYINEAKFKELSAFELHPNEILVSCSGTVGKVAIVPANIERGIINQALLKLSIHQSAMLNEYFLILFPAFFMETDTLTNLSGTAQKNIPGMDVLKAMPFPLPPLAEQRRIVAKVDQLMALVDELELQLAESRTVAANLLSAVVAELTTQT